MAEGQSKGRPLLTADAWIAATALELDLKLVTHNPKDFAVIERLKLITEA
jgi:predicted nucleic acid-binding protein